MQPHIACFLGFSPSKTQTVSGYDQEIPQSHTSDQPMASCLIGLFGSILCVLVNNFSVMSGGSSCVKPVLSRD